jgi:hypothetical protein
LDFVSRIIDLATRPVPLRTLIIRKLLTRWPIGPYRARLTAGAVDRPAYGFCMFHAAEQAKALGFKAISAIELGVAGGNGLLCMCRHRDEIKKDLGIDIHLYGFDSGVGLPSSDDPRDVLYYWAPGSYAMDCPALKKRLAGRAKLIFGNIAETAVELQTPPDAPLGTILFDLDLYSSTIAAFKLLACENALPRVWCYFDDVTGGPLHALVDSVGEREAIRQFNMAPERRILRDNISRAYVFATKPPESWHERIYLYHRQSHPAYNTLITVNDEQQMPLNPE